MLIICYQYFRLLLILIHIYWMINNKVCAGIEQNDIVVFMRIVSSVVAS